jgi:hypothetical protein
MTWRKTFVLTLILSSLLFLASCNDSDSSVTDGTAEVQVLLTDAPSDYIESALVKFSRVYLQGGEDFDLMDDSEEWVEYDLMELQNGVTVKLSDDGIMIPAGTYHQLRMVVLSAIVTLKDPATFTDGSSTATLFVPSGMESGIKVQLADSIEAGDGSLTVVLVDFDVDENFVIHGNPAPNGVTDILFTPLLNEKSRDTVALD